MSLEKNLSTLHQHTSDLKSRITVLEELILREQDSLNLEKATFVSNQQEHQILHFEPDDIIQLNVGGTYFSTNHKTLVAIPSVLSAMFSGRVELTPLDDNSYFIDRDPKMFRHIMNYLRTEVMIWPEDPREKKLVQEEFEFFNFDYKKIGRNVKKVFTYTSDFDTQGLMYWLGMDKGSGTSWQNPRKLGHVDIESEQGYYRIINNTADRYNNTEDLNIPFEYNKTPTYCLTSSTTHNYFVINLKRSFKISMMTLSDYYSPTSYLENLRFMGSNDKASWKEYTTEKLPLVGMVKSWRFSTNNDFFKFLKIQGGGQVLISGMELYGELGKEDN